MSLNTIQPAANAHVRVNENFAAMLVAAMYARDYATTTGTTWGYTGAIYNGNTIDDGTVALTDNATNYVVVLRSTGVVSAATTTTNWTSASYARLYKVVTASGVISSVEDHRLDTNGLFSGASPVGKHSIWIPAAAMQPSVSGGCAALATVATSAGQPDIAVLDFDASSVETAQFSIAMPKSWNEGTVTFRALWTHPSTTTNFGVAWSLQGVAMSDDDTIGAAFGTAITVTDTGGTTIDMYRTAESAAVTIGGTPAAEDIAFFKVARETANGSDTMAVDARLLGVTLFITTDAATDE
jgi:hypothetical protein